MAALDDDESAKELADVEPLLNVVVELLLLLLLLFVSGVVVVVVVLVVGLFVVGVDSMGEPMALSDMSVLGSEMTRGVEIVIVSYEDDVDVVVLELVLLLLLVVLAFMI